MKQDGYTLAEMLVALVVIGLTIGGMTQGIRVMTRLQAATGQQLTKGRDLRGIDVGLNGLLQDRGPFNSSDAAAFSGSAAGFAFDCARPQPCKATLSAAGASLVLSLAEADGSVRNVALPGVQVARFTYAGTQTFGQDWPVATIEPQTLRTVGLVEVTPTGEAPLASVRLWRDQPAYCAYDAIARACRGRPS